MRYHKTTATNRNWETIPRKREKTTKQQTWNSQHANSCTQLGLILPLWAVQNSHSTAYLQKDNIWLMSSEVSKVKRTVLKPAVSIVAQPGLQQEGWLQILFICQSPCVNAFGLSFFGTILILFHPYQNKLKLRDTITWGRVSYASEAWAKRVWTVWKKEGGTSWPAHIYPHHLHTALVAILRLINDRV